LTGRRNEAITALKQAIALGYPLNLIESAPDLLTLRRDARYQKLLIDMEKKSKNMTYEKPWMKLSVHFDADQITNQLDYAFTSCDGSADPRHGPYMGGVHFQQGQHVYLEVNCCGTKKSGFTGFQIVDCCLITVPQLTQIGPDVPTRYSLPSPFLQSVGATYQFPWILSPVCCHWIQPCPT
jgi:hypothetical protein